MAKFSQFAMIDAFRAAFKTEAALNDVSVGIFKEAGLCTVRVTCGLGAPSEQRARQVAKIVGKQAKAELEFRSRKPVNATQADFTFKFTPRVEKNRPPTKANVAKWARAVKRTRDLERKRARLAVA